MRNIAAIIIPGRLDSKRYPRKLLKEFEGKPLLQHAYEGASKSRNAFVTILALDEDELCQAAKKFAPPAQVFKVHGNFKNGAERTAYASRFAVLGKADIIVLVQGDELFVDSDLIDALIAEVSSFETDIATAVIKRKAEHGGKDPSKVKASIKDGYLVSLDREDREEDFYEHIGITAFRKAALWKIAGSNPSKNERLHNNEYWRPLDLGMNIKVVETEKEVLNVNTTEDHVKAVQYFEAKRKAAEQEQELLNAANDKRATKPRERKTNKAKRKRKSPSKAKSTSKKSRASNEGL